MDSSVSKLIKALSSDIVVGEKDAPTLAQNSDFYLLMIGLLITYESGEQAENLINIASKEVL